MGIVTGTLHKQYLIAYKNELEYKMSLIAQAKMELSSSASDLLTAGTDMDPENPVLKQLEQRKERLNLLEKKLDMQLDEYKTKLQMVEANIQVCDKVIDSAIGSMKG
jgi:capsule polysaccharide export protein KpsE/RkpR